MRHRSRSSLVALTLVLVVVLVFPSNALALLEDEAKYTSFTNPGIGQDATWRWGWGNTWNPHLIVTTIPTDGNVQDKKETLGFLYWLNQVDLSNPGFFMPDWDNGMVSPLPQGTLIENTLNIEGFLNRNGGWHSNPGASQEGEGLYAVSLLFYNQFRVEDTSTVDVQNLGVDFTAPSPVTNLTADNGGSPATPSGWTEARQRRLIWNRAKYDALSGVGGFEVSLNGKKVTFAQNIAPRGGLFGEPYADIINSDQPTREQLNQVSIEDLPAGVSTLGVTVVDRATNRSDEKTVKAYVDYDTPKITITAPTSGKTVPVSTTLSVNASDDAGIAKVVYSIDGVQVAQSTTAPYTAKVNLAGLTDGARTLTATVYDNIGELKGSKWKVDHVESASTTFKLDKTAPVLSSITGSVSPFYPVQRDGYRDDFRVSFNSNEVGSAKLTIKNSKGVVVRTITKASVAGSNFIAWDGKNSSGAFVGGTYTWVLSCMDAVGNASVTGARSVVLKAKTDETPPKITKVSANYTTFFPRKRDKYKDDLKVKFTVNEPGTAKLVVKNSKGKVVRTVTKKVSKAGASSIVWNGKYNDGKTVKAGKFTHKLSFTDNAGNTSSVATRKVTIKFFQLTKTARNKLKVIER